MLDVKTIELEFRQFCAANMYDYEVFADSDFRHMAYRLMVRNFVASIQRVDKVTAPATRWDVIKDLFLPKWARKYINIQYRDLSATATAMLPDLKPLQKAHCIVIAVHDTSSLWNSLPEESNW